MFDRIITLNEFLLSYFDNVVTDLDEAALAIRPDSGGNSALWIIGHLALCAEFVDTVLGDELQHRQWVPVFGPGSSGDVDPGDGYTRDTLVNHVRTGYRRNHGRILAAPAELMDQPHGVEILVGSRLKSKADLVAHLLTTHFSFHLGQLSGLRRGLGNPPLI